MQLKQKMQRGFTIVELLIVIVVIGILAAITIVAYNGIQDRANLARIDSDLASLNKAIMAARASTGKTLYDIINSGNHTGGACSTGQPGGTDVSTLPSTSSCWLNYNLALDRIATASGANLDSIRAGDPYGQPYYIDQNEGENPTNPCRADLIGSLVRPLPATMNNYNWVENRRDITFSLGSC